MPVFISHRTQDDLIAQVVYDRLKRQGITCYLDHVDPNANSTNRITQVILEALEKSTHLLAVITDNTRLSWWVPFEIGVAQHGARRITSLSKTTQSLPEYLHEWPVLIGDKAIDVFADAYKKDSQAARIRKGALMESVELRSQHAAASSFHTDLKSRLRFV